MLTFLENFSAVTWQMVVMWLIGGILIYLAIKKEMEPTLLLPMGFGAILVNLPFSGAVEVLETLYNAGISNELFPLLLFIGIGAMIDFGPLLSNPKMLLFGAAAQFGIFFTLSVASLLGFDLTDAASIAIIGAADGPTSIVVANYFGTKYIGAIVVAAYSYMALVPIVQPFCIKLITTKAERRIRMKYNPSQVSKTTRILFPILVTAIAGLAAPASVALVGFLMFGNLLRECGVLNALSETAQKVLANLVTLLLGFDCGRQHACRRLPGSRNADDTGPGLGSVHVRYIWRRVVCQDTQPVLQGKDQPDDRRGRYIGIPDGFARCAQAGARRRPQQLAADACSGH